MIEKTPIFNVTKETFDLLLDNDLKPLFNKINTEYLYWDKVNVMGTGQWHDKPLLRGIRRRLLDPLYLLLIEEVQLGIDGL